MSCNGTMPTPKSRVGAAELVGIVLPAADDGARHADKADVVQQRGGFQRALLLRRKFGDLPHRAREFGHAAGLVAERGIIRLHRVDAEFDRAAQIRFERGIQFTQF